MTIRRAIAADIPFIVEMERTCPTAAHWTEQQYLQAVRSTGPSERLCLVAESADFPSGARSTIAGFLVAHRVDFEWELENIVVAVASRRTGLGKRLLDGLLAEVRATAGTTVFLEVRESNTAAGKVD